MQNNERLSVLMVAAECVPFAKVGGLADVIGALPAALEKLGVSVKIAIPRHRAVDLHKFGFEPYPITAGSRVPLGLEHLSYDVYRGVLPDTSVEVFLIGNDRFFGREGIYLDADSGKDYPDQADRWIFFQRAVMDFARAASGSFDVVHCHDHQTGLVPPYLEKFYRAGALQAAGTVFTIHNMGYQGLFPRETMGRAGLDYEEFYPMSPFEFYGTMNFMKAGISYADFVTTVSETYAREIQQSREFGYGLEGVLRERSRDLAGILNGIDDRLWNPETDPLIAARYGVSDLSGKAENKKALLHSFGLDNIHVDWPVLGMLSRIEVQKGFDLVVAILDELLSKDVYFLVLGTGNRETESLLKGIMDQHPDRTGIHSAFDNGSAHLMEAGSDIFLMPSRYEPCGLNQMYSLRYGTVPIVRSTGGLADTVQEFDPATAEGTGFCFRDYDPEQFRTAIDRALNLWQHQELWRRLMLNGMNQNFSWNESATKYLDVYGRVASKRRSS